MNTKNVLTISVVLHENKPEHIVDLCACLSTEDIAMRVYFIDNSPDQSLATCFENYPQFHYEWTGKNIGFGKAHNRVISQCIDNDGYHLCLNPDVYFAKGMLVKMIQFMDSRPDIGLLLPRVLNPDQSEQPLYKLLPNPQVLFFRRFFPAFVKQMLSGFLASYELSDANPTDVFEAPYLSGCFMLMRREALKEVGLFDERYFLYFEDVDLSRRINESWSTVYFGQAVIYHYFQRGSYNSFKLLLYHLISGFRYFNKYGWFRDEQRDKVNRETIDKIKAEKLVVQSKTKVLVS